MAADHVIELILYRKLDDKCFLFPTIFFRILYIGLQDEPYNEYLLIHKSCDFFWSIGKN